MDGSEHGEATKGKCGGQGFRRHDAAQMAALTPMAMLFVRCKEGIRHNPAESVKKGDEVVAIETMNRFLRLMGESELAGERRDTS